VDPSVGKDDVQKGKLLTLPGLELRPLGPPAHSQSLHRLCSNMIVIIWFIFYGCQTCSLTLSNKRDGDVCERLLKRIFGRKTEPVTDICSNYTTRNLHSDLH
jgi:hypothetical protein